MPRCYCRAYGCGEIEGGVNVDPRTIKQHERQDRMGAALAAADAAERDTDNLVAQFVSSMAIANDVTGGIEPGGSLWSRGQKHLKDKRVEDLASALSAGSSHGSTRLNSSHVNMASPQPSKANVDTYLQQLAKIEVQIDDMHREIIDISASLASPQIDVAAISASLNHYSDLIGKLGDGLDTIKTQQHPVVESKTAIVKKLYGLEKMLDSVQKRWSKISKQLKQRHGLGLYYPTGNP